MIRSLAGTLLFAKVTPLSKYRKIAQQVLEIEAAAISGVIDQIDEGFDRAIELMVACQGRIVCTGMGKSGHVMKKVSATLASTGSPSFFLHPAEAIHGDLGMITGHDVVLAASASGTTDELLRMLPSLKRRQIPLVAITGKPESTLAQHADCHLAAVIDQEACPLNLAPTASTTATMALGDALAMALLEAKGFTPEDFAQFHPGGQLGRRLLRVEELMHTGDAVPLVTAGAPLHDAIYEMSKKGLGITAVVDDDRKLLGVISDGDLRRLLSEPTPSGKKRSDLELLETDAASCMKPDPRTIEPTELGTAALKSMEDHRITSLFVCDDEGRVDGIVHLHDLWGLGTL